MIEVATVTLVVASLLALISLVQPIAERLHVPYTVLLAAVGVIVGIVSTFLLYTPLTDAFDKIVAPLVNLPFNASVFIVVFLPLLLFQAALTIDVREMIQDAAPILMLAVVAVFVAAATIGFGLSMVAGMPIVVTLLLGTIVATTDPAAVVAIFRELSAPARLTRLVEGESLLNDAAAIVLFTMLLDMLVSGRPPDIAAESLRFAERFAGGVALGLISARLFAALLPLLGGLRTAEMTLTLALPYLAYLMGERVVEVSGVVAVVTAGLTMGVYGRARLSPENWAYLEQVWEQIGFWAGSLIFISASILVPKLLVGIDFHDLGLVLVLVGAALAARALVLFVLLPLLSALKLSHKVSWAYKIAITWGGLRGAVTLALALAVTENPLLDPNVQRFIAILATGFVLFTLLVNALTLRPMIRLLKLDRLSPLNQALRNKVLALSFAEVKETVYGMAHAYEIGPKIARAVAQPYEARIREVSAQRDLEEAISDRDRIIIGLVALANRERRLILEHHAQRTVSASVIERLLREAGRILDGAKAEGRIGYLRAGRALLSYNWAFRFAHFLHRWLGLDHALRRQVSARFEALLVRRLVLEELRRFNQRRLSPLLGGRVAELLGEVLSGRHEATSRALDALRLTYPEHADALERRFLKQSALRMELAQYRDLYDKGLVGRELFEDLLRDHQRERRRVEARPPLDLGLRTEELLLRFEMFRNLGQTERGALTRLFRPRLAVPEQIIIRSGERGSSMFFISSGAVEVVLQTHRVRLGRGDFFGEMALLSGRRRQADVVALGYCQLLVLSAADFRRFLKAHPSAKAEIDRVVEARTLMNQRRAATPAAGPS